MSYNGTVRCSYCYNKGHNRRSCPELKKFIEENPDSWRAVQARESKKRASKRKCSWCDNTGHNLRTCPWRKDIQENGPALIQKVNKLHQHIVAKRGSARGALLRWGNNTVGSRVVTKVVLDRKNQVPDAGQTPTLAAVLTTWGEPRMNASNGKEKWSDTWIPSQNHEADEAHIEEMCKLLTAEEADKERSLRLYRDWGYGTMHTKVPCHIVDTSEIAQTRATAWENPGGPFREGKFVDWEKWHNLIDRVIQGIG